MSEPEKEKSESIGRLTGKTTTHTVQVLISNPDVDRNNFFAIYGGEKKDGTRDTYLLNIVDMWTDEKGLRATIKVLSERPKKPFDMGLEVFRATKEDITTLLGICNPPEKSISIGKLIGYQYDVNLLVKNFGRIFITGKSGSGKSYTMGVLCEEFLKKGIPVVIIDRHGEYGALKVVNDEIEIEKEKPASFETESGVCPWCGEEVQKDDTACTHCGKSLKTEISESRKIEDSKASEFADNIIEYTDIKMNPSGDVDIEYLFSLEATDIVAPRLCSIINLRGLDLEVQEVIAGKLLKKLYLASTNRKIPPFYLFLDEAHLFAGKKQTDTCEVVKLFAQEGRKFGANIVVGTQRPQLLDVTIRAQSGTWIIHNLSDVRDIGITIQSAEDLSKENTTDISGLEKGEAIICGEAVKRIPIFIKVRKRITKHGGVGFNPLDFLSDKTVEGLQKRKDKILGKKSKEELESGKSEFKELFKPKTTNDYTAEIEKLKERIQELEDEVQKLKEEKGIPTEIPTEISGDENEIIKELKTQIQVWKEKYNYMKQKEESGVKPVARIEGGSEKVLALEKKIKDLENEVKKQKNQYEGMKKLAEKSISEAKKRS